MTTIGKAFKKLDVDTKELDKGLQGISDGVKDLYLKKELEKIDWPIEYGNVRIQLRAGKPTLVTIERTVKLD